MIEALDRAVENSSRLPQRIATKTAAAAMAPTMVIDALCRSPKRCMRRQAAASDVVTGSFSPRRYSASDN